jgi:gamma-glutamylcyclotransferase (GGCT)/AIG2-like uncharacterized protein YtfP
MTGEATAVLPVFVYGTLRAGSWNHDAWLAPWLAGPTEPATLPGYALHHHGGLPYITPSPERFARGELARLDPARYDEGLMRLDELEDIDDRHYDRVVVEVGGEPAFVYVAGPRIAARLGAGTEIPSGDWLDAAPMRTEGPGGR